MVNRCPVGVLREVGGGLAAFCHASGVPATDGDAVRLMRYVALVVATLTCSSCGGGGLGTGVSSPGHSVTQTRTTPASAPQPSQTGATSSATVTSAPPSTSASSSDSPSSEPPAPVGVLPDSVLRTARGFTLVAIPGAPNVPSVMAAKPEVYAGYLGRAVRSQGKLVGTVQVLRLRHGVITSDGLAREILDNLVEEFARTSKIRHQVVAGHAVTSAQNIRGTAMDAIGWRTGDDFVIVTSSVAPVLAKAYI
jgi:hypothetical protein